MFVFKPTEIHFRGIHAFVLWLAMVITIANQFFGFVDWVLRHVRFNP